MDPALFGDPGSVAGAEATDQNSGAAVEKEKGAAREMGPKGSEVQDPTTRNMTQSREEKPDYGTSITTGRETSPQDQQVWAQLAEPDGQRIRLVAGMEN